MCLPKFTKLHISSTWTVWVKKHVTPKAFAQTKSSRCRVKFTDMSCKQIFTAEHWTQELHHVQHEHTRVVEQAACVRKSLHVGLHWFLWMWRPAECSLEDETYEDGAETQVECNRCVCACGNWVCTAMVCPGEWESWGNPPGDEQYNHYWAARSYCHLWDGRGSWVSRLQSCHFLELSGGSNVSFPLFKD